MGTDYCRRGRNVSAYMNFVFFQFLFWLVSRNPIEEIGYDHVVWNTRCRLKILHVCVSNKTAGACVDCCYVKRAVQTGRVWENNKCGRRTYPSHLHTPPNAVIGNRHCTCSCLLCAEYGRGPGKRIEEDVSVIVSTAHRCRDKFISRVWGTWRSAQSIRIFPLARTNIRTGKVGTDEWSWKCKNKQSTTRSFYTFLVNRSVFCEEQIICVQSFSSMNGQMFNAIVRSYSKYFNAHSFRRKSYVVFFYTQRWI